MLIKQTKEDLEFFKQQYINLGYEIMPAAIPNELRIGYSAYKPTGEEVICLWSRFPNAKINSPVIMESADGFVRLFESYRQMKHIFKTDLPKQLLRGFVVFNPDANEISSYQIRFTHLAPYKEISEAIANLPELTLE
jgi:hypothetical protein